MGVKKTVPIVLIALLCCVAFYFLSNQLVISENNLPEELRVIHFYDKTPGVSGNILSDEIVTDKIVIAEMMDKLEGRYLRVPVDRDFFGVEKQQYELCISGPMGVCKDIDIRDNGSVIIDDEAYIRIGNDTEELYDELMEEIKDYNK